MEALGGAVGSDWVELDVGEIHSDELDKTKCDQGDE